MYNKTHVKRHWGEEGVGPGHCLAHADSYVVFILLEADADIHDTGKEMGRTGIQDVSGWSKEAETTRLWKDQGRHHDRVSMGGWVELDTDGEGTLLGLERQHKEKSRQKRKNSNSSPTDNLAVWA